MKLIEFLNQRVLLNGRKLGDTEVNRPAVSKVVTAQLTQITLYLGTCIIRYNT